MIQIKIEIVFKGNVTITKLMSTLFLKNLKETARDKL